MLGEEGVYRAAQNNYLEQTEFGWMVDSIGMRVTLRRINCLEVEGTVCE